jgi:hypothetical protein
MTKQELEEMLDLMITFTRLGKSQEAKRIRNYVVRHVGDMVEFWE